MGERMPSDPKMKAELEYWVRLSRDLTKGCATEAERAEALFRVCTQVASPRYMAALHLDETSFTGMRVLDVGCGPHGGLVLFRDCERYGIDHLVAAYKGLGYPLERHGVTYVDCKAERTPFADAFFDVVTCVNALDHVDDLEAVIREIARVLKPRGRVLGQFGFHHRPTPTEPICLDHSTLEKAFAAHGLMLRRREFQARDPVMKEDRFYYEVEKDPLGGCGDCPPVAAPSPEAGLEDVPGGRAPRERLDGAWRAAASRAAAAIRRLIARR
jgi:SAM-dependent methyltransferase